MGHIYPAQSYHTPEKRVESDRRVVVVMDIDSMTHFGRVQTKKRVETTDSARPLTA